MDTCSFHTPPNQVKKTYNTPDNAQANLENLIKLHQMGVITKEELREKVLAWNPNPVPTVLTTATPSVTVTVTSPESVSSARPTNKRRESDCYDTTTKQQQPLKKKPRTGKPIIAVAQLRKIAKNPIRRRFFEQCCDPRSILWSKSCGGKEALRKLLFVAASQDPINLIYQEHPGQTHGIQYSEVMNVVRWQVYKDRSNWLGKTPKRALDFGSPLAFDWEAQLSKLQGKQQSKPIQSFQSAPSNQQSKPIQSFQSAPSKQQSKPVKSFHQSAPSDQQSEPVLRRVNSIDVDSLKPCQNCGHILWLGKESEVPNGIKVAYPLGSDWMSNLNVEPYCATCWDAENELLQNLTGKYKAVGRKSVIKAPVIKAPVVKQPDVVKKKVKETTKTVKKKTTKAVKKKTTKTVKKKATKTVKKKATTKKATTKAQLGGVQGKLDIDNASTALWQEGQSVNARYSDGKYYGAFISKVNDDGTYLVYFQECGTLLFDVPAQHIKVPIMSGKTSKNLNKYRGQVFFDKGGVDNETGIYFEPGEFVVKSVTSDNNFLCGRVGSPPTDEDEPFDISYVIKRIREYEEE